MLAQRHPSWLRRKAVDPKVIIGIKELLDGLSLHTVCESAYCPNQVKCLSKGEVTFLILGNVCTRNCTFCAVERGPVSLVDPREPANVAEAVKELGLNHVVVTSVTRDDLPDGGASHFARTIDAIRMTTNRTTVEVLIPDFNHSNEALKVVIDSFPEVLGHNIETIPRLYPGTRPRADYHRSLHLLQTAKSFNPRIITKSGLMLGLGEEPQEVVSVLEDLRAADCDCITLGQYLSPSSKHHPVVKYLTPQEFEKYLTLAIEMGFSAVRSAPFVRSSFDASDICREAKTRISIVSPHESLRFS